MQNWEMGFGEEGEDGGSLRYESKKSIEYN